jgi:hypothetical protein
MKALSMKHVMSVAMILAICGVAVMAQGTAPAKPEKAIVPLRVQLVISRYQGDKKTENLPFTLSVNANDSNQPATLNNAQRVRIPEVQPNGQTAFSWQNVGTTLSVRADVMDDGRLQMMVSITDTSLVPGDTNGGNLPSTRSFTLAARPIMRDGQTVQFVTATDKITGDQTKVDLTVTSVK